MWNNSFLKKILTNNLFYSSITFYFLCYKLTQKKIIIFNVKKKHKNVSQQFIHSSTTPHFFLVTN